MSGLGLGLGLGWLRVTLCVCEHQSGTVTNPARGQLNWENGNFPVTFRA